MIVAPIAHIEQTSAADANRLLTAWEHKMGPCNRPNFDMWAHALFHNGEPVALAVTAGLICPVVAGMTRDQAVELARLCACRPGLNRVMLRCWREFVFVPMTQRHGWSWAISYQDERLHLGDTYRFDGWVALQRTRSGTDSRSGKRGRNKTVWGWTPDAEALTRARATAQPVVDRRRVA